MGQDKTRYLLSYYCLQFLSMQLPKMLVIACQINIFVLKPDITDNKLKAKGKEKKEY